MGAGLIDDFIRNILFVPFCPCHFVHTILSNAILSLYHFVHTILSVPFCPLPFCPRTLGPSIKYVTLFLSKFYRPPPCHTSSHIPGPPRKYATHLGPPDF